MTDISVATYSLTEGDNGAQVSVVFSDGTTETITDKHANFSAIVQALVNKPAGYGATVYDLANIAKTVGRKFKNLSSRVTTDGSELFFDGDPIDNSLAQFILKLLREDAQNSAAFFEGKSEDAGEDASQVTWEALVKFLELLYANPNKASQESLYEFISRYGLTIRKDGYFIAYKGLNSEFGSKHTGYGIVDGVEVNGVLYNKPGSVLRFPRKDVDSNTAVGCSQGLHAGTHAYATQWAGGGKLVAVAISPTNVVSVPDHCTFQKLRVCEYEVLNEVDPLETAVATSGWESSSFWDAPTEWKDDYSSVDGVAQDFIGTLSEGDTVDFDYLSLDGNTQSVEDARIEELEFDQFKAFVPSKNGYRSFKHKGVSNIGLSGGVEVEEDEAPEAEASEAAEPEVQTAETGESFFDKIADTLQNGGGQTPAEWLKSLGGISEDLQKKVKDRFSDFDVTKVASAADLEEAKRIFREGSAAGAAQVEDLVGRLQDKAKGASSKATSGASVDLKEGTTVSFDYISTSGDEQHISEARVEEVQPELFKAFVTSKDGYRSFKFEGVSNLIELNEAAPEAENPAEQDSSSVIREQLAKLKIGDYITVVLDSNGAQEKVENARVLLASSSSVTVRLADGGYKAFSAYDVVTISKK